MYRLVQRDIKTSENDDDGDKPKTQNIQSMNWLEIIGDDDTPF